MKKRTKATPSPINKPVSNKVFQPRNKSQELAWTTINSNIITFLLGPAGTAKTYIATAYSISAVRRLEFEKIVVTRPLVEAHESLGWLPGEIDDKIAPYMEPVSVCANKFGKHNVEIVTKPIAFMRGVTFENSIHILDEAQNCTRDQLKLYLTRLGRAAKIIICGDLDQSDINDSGLASIVKDLEGIPKIAVFRFSVADIVRHHLVNIMVTKFSESESRAKRSRK